MNDRFRWFTHNIPYSVLFVDCVYVATVATYHPHSRTFTPSRSFTSTSSRPTWSSRVSTIAAGSPTSAARDDSPPSQLLRLPPPHRRPRRQRPLPIGVSHLVETALSNTALRNYWASVPLPQWRLDVPDPRLREPARRTSTPSEWRSGSSSNVGFRSLDSSTLHWRSPITSWSTPLGRTGRPRAPIDSSTTLRPQRRRVATTSRITTGGYTSGAGMPTSIVDRLPRRLRESSTNGCAAVRLRIADQLASFDDVLRDLCDSANCLGL